MSWSNPRNVRCLKCGQQGCSHPELRGRVFTKEQWEALPDVLPPGRYSPLGTPKNAVYYEESRENDRRPYVHGDSLRGDAPDLENPPEKADVET